MTIGEKIKWMRSDRNMSQNELADALGVSRQAITKWETDSGVPEIDNIVAIAKLFGTTVDALVTDEASCYSSFIQYDIDGGKDFEIGSVPAKMIDIHGLDSEKIRVEVHSDSISKLDSDIKFRIEEKKRRLCLEIGRRNDLTDTVCRNDLKISIGLPKKYVGGIELKAETGTLALSGFTTKDMEFDGAAKEIVLDDVRGQVEMNLHSDTRFKVKNLDGRLDVNIWEQSCTVEIPRDVVFKAVNTGRKCELIIAENLNRSDSSEDIIGLNGMKGTLSIVAMDPEDI
ncbi:MAG: helix-turn-helix domain-containing protein [Thermoplasmata archaeon]|jgi:transcriptional regulator with XRE-family HTH domain|nr:helix-turn-helix domain-containing protein [Thermoplasmata archaeon]